MLARLRAQLPEHLVDALSACLNRRLVRLMEVHRLLAWSACRPPRRRRAPSASSNTASWLLVSRPTTGLRTRLRFPKLSLNLDATQLEFSETLATLSIWTRRHETQLKQTAYAGPPPLKPLTQIPLGIEVCN